MSDYFNLNDGVKKVERNFTRPNLNLNKKIVISLAVLLAVPLTVGLALTQQRFFKFASGAEIASISINPGSVESIMGGKNTQLSALAYDSSGNPITSGVSYEWSMSSINSVGTLSRTTGDITEFIPFNVGCGEITVIAIANGITVTKAISAFVANELGVSTCSTTPLPTSIPSPTMTPIPTVAPSPTPTAPVSSSYHRVFVTSGSYEGSMGGLAGANSKCMQSAQAANLGGVWKAWLSDSYSNPGSQMNLIDKNVPYKLLNGTVIANNWTDLTDGSLLVPISISEFNQIRTSFRGLVWTNSNTDGTSSNPSNSCRNWSSYSDRDFGGVGNFNSTDANWSNTRTSDCSNLLPLYCVEQGVVTDPTPTPLPSIETPTPTNFPTPILGDYNGSGAVDIGDFNLWKDEFLGNSATLKSDVNNDGKIDLIDYINWRNNYQL